MEATKCLENFSETLLNIFLLKTKIMKRIFLLTLAGALTMATFASDKGKSKKYKNKNAVKTEKVCPPGCHKTGCDKM
jgi:hypothetical protein